MKLIPRVLVTVDKEALISKFLDDAINKYLANNMWKTNEIG